MSGKKTADAQLERLRGAPALVRWLVMEAGCWVLGSRADFVHNRIDGQSDWDILVEPHNWQRVAAVVTSQEQVGPTKLVGWRLEAHAGRPRIDIIVASLSDMMVLQHTYAAWHPKSGQMLVKFTLEGS